MKTHRGEPPRCDCYSIILVIRLLTCRKTQRKAEHVSDIKIAQWQLSKTKANSESASKEAKFWGNFL
jgi:hypothetical protein